MINRDTCYSALFKLKTAGFDVTKQLEIMAKNRGVPREVLLFLRENSPHFQFYRYIQKHQKALAKNLLDYDSLSNNQKIICASSFITRAYIAVEYKELDASLLDDLNLLGIASGLKNAVSLLKDFTGLDLEMKKHQESLRLFYTNN